MIAVQAVPQAMGSGRRTFFASAGSSAFSWLAAAGLAGALLGGARASRAAAAVADTSDKSLKMEDMPRLNGLSKRRTKFPDFTVTPSGLQVKEITRGKPDGQPAGLGDTVVLAWEGYTINYFGRPFETRKLQETSKVQVEPLRFKVGDGTVIPAIDEAVRGQTEGSVRQLIIPVEIGYDLPDKKLLPRPSTFSGQRALDFVLDNKGGLMDKTLLMNISIKRVYSN